MKVKALLQVYQDELKSLYPPEEIEAIFYRLAGHFEGIKRIDVSLNPDMIMQTDILQAILPKLKQHTPWQYITGETEFYGRPFKVNSSVLIPRPETEELVDWIIQDYKNSSKPLRILDIGTGSGAIAISLAKHLSNAAITGYDISKPALETARKNAVLNNVNVDFQQVDILKQDHLQTGFDIIVSNPPYVRIQEKDKMQNNVLDYEPETALFVPDDNPLLFYKKIIDLALLQSPIDIYFEINENLKSELTRLLSKQNIDNFQFKKDLFGKWRMLKIIIK